MHPRFVTAALKAAVHPWSGTVARLSLCLTTRCQIPSKFPFNTANLRNQSTMISPALPTQKFRYLAVLDFEATCDDKVNLSPQEIIEFPTVVIDTAQPLFPVVKEFHSYVKPTFHPTLTPFCTSLTGIQQETVDKAPVFKVVWDQFLQFLDENNLTESNTLFVTCGHWDLVKMLPAQLNTLHITHTPKVLQQWCNIKIFASHHLKAEVRGLPFLLHQYRLPLIGRHHSGIDDSRNVAAVARRLLEYGLVFRVTPKHEQLPKFQGTTAKPPPPPHKVKAKPASLEPLPAMIDIGANLTHKTFSKNMPDILKNARAANVRHIIITGTSVEVSRSAIELCRRHNATNLDAGGDEFPMLKCTVGIHPHDASRAMKNSKENFEALEKLITENRDIVVAVGECGLDYDRQFSSHEDQVHVFTQQAMLAARLDMPLFFHERSAHDAFMQVVRDVNQIVSKQTMKKLRGVVHCFTGETMDVLNAYLDEGFYLGITGWVTDERPERGAGLARLVNKIPLDRLMVETDAPFLMPRNIKPSPKICEPALVGHVVKRVAELYNIDASEVADCTTRNAAKLFSL
ncbi:hypothetical protein HDU78_002671 [Chytriomyces hyalinus]|nr:hypothetical protein HDU78_002671 [Chytriomyces hyalinus]